MRLYTDRSEKLYDNKIRLSCLFNSKEKYMEAILLFFETEGVVCSDETNRQAERDQVHNNIKEFYNSQASKRKTSSKHKSLPVFLFINIHLYIDYI
jgi:hypothetical protein